MNSRIVRFAVFFAALFSLSSCSDSAEPGDPNGGTTGNSDSSYGITTVAIDQDIKFTSTDNFYCYDTRDSSFHLLFKGNGYTMIFVLRMPQLTVGTHTFGSGTKLSIFGPRGGMGSGLQYNDEIKVTFSKLDPITQQFAFVLTAKFYEPFATLNGIQSIRVDSGGFVYYPNAVKSSMEATVGGVMYSTATASELSGYAQFGGSDYWLVYQAFGTSGKSTFKSFILNIGPKPGVVGTYPMALSFYELHNDLPATKADDSSYGSISGTLEITTYDKQRNMISGTFSGILKNEKSAATLPVTGGVFKNLVLEPN